MFAYTVKLKFYKKRSRWRIHSGTRKYLPDGVAPPMFKAPEAPLDRYAHGNEAVGDERQVQVELLIEVRVARLVLGYERTEGKGRVEEDLGWEVE